MNSDSESLAPGENQGELNVSVRARCCSAITRREIRWHEVSKGSMTGPRNAGTDRSKNGVHKLVKDLGVHMAVAFKNAHGQLGYDCEVGLEHSGDDLAEPFVLLESLDLLDLSKCVKCSVV